MYVTESIILEQTTNVKANDIACKKDTPYNVVTKSWIKLEHSQTSLGFYRYCCGKYDIKKCCV
jgi:hypothetical protein